MNYIINQINRKINLLKGLDKKSELKVHYQSKLEFYLILILGYLWNKNFEDITEDEKEQVIETILKPSIGSIISASRTLDIKSDFFGNKKMKDFLKAINDYPKIRNEKIGHGYSYEDTISEYLEVFENLINKIEESDIFLFKDKIDIIVTTSKSGEIHKGIQYKSNGSDYLAWSCPDEVFSFKENSIYIKNESDYFRVSPFIFIENENDFYSFSSIEEKLTGRVKFNQLIRTGKIYVEFEELAKIDIANDGLKRKTSNGTIINEFSKNYKKYIDVGVSNKVIKFLTKNNSSVFATLWGHGGIGKTAAIQNVCEILANQERKKFDYIIFLSAKDRYYNFYKGVIQELKDSIKTLAETIDFINSIVFSDDSSGEEAIINYEGNMLIVIDDFETFSKAEKNKITSFIRKLDINHHKVILTTRSATLITGEEIETNELDEKNTIAFLIEAFRNEIPSYNVEKDIKSFNTYSNLIHNVTSGRPLFILQFAILLAQKGSLEETLLIDIKSTEEAKNFLYDRIYDYLSQDAKNMFLAINLLVNKDDLTGLLNNLRFLLNKEDKLEEFEDALNELVKLKIIILEDKDFFKVYSYEILKIMQSYYENKGSDYDSSITNRYTQISSDDKLDTDYALLKVADSNRIVASESEVENQYRRIIKRENADFKLRVRALLNYANYLFSQKGQVDKALKLFDDYWHWFNNTSEFIIMQVRYCWAEGTKESKYKAINTLKGYLAKKPKIDEEILLEIIGTLMTYSGIMIVAEREDIKEKKRFKDISDKKYESLNSEQRTRFNELFRYPGLKLYNTVKDRDLMSFSPKCRNFILDGLTHFSEICIRVNKRKIAKDVCAKIITELPADYHKPFLHKIKKINFIENRKPSKKIVESDLASKLKQALNK
ncbi:NB-ARC domain-containing protein [Arenibacter certesii]|uniref:NB-ARC domain-containing protein n=1 Tax=Arenibacter certesii TaxID=228955 RepID=A0A918MPU8_9FLAO|nr:NB-ARC domain-containing protein [Arenibacter certesii]GGW43947.1 hypothetical protein GCM10007383_30610 [Arenibacter certesii]